MAGIQVHTSSPINTNAPTKSKETTAEPTRTQDGPAYAPATTTAASTSPMTAQPGAAPPAPSAAATAYAPPSPTRTTAVTEGTGPPPPQPGQVPQPFSERSVPPPPKASSMYSDQSQQIPQTAPPVPAPQFIPSYAYAQPAAGTTSTAKDLSHPPGYIQHDASFDDRYVEPENLTLTPSPTKGRGILDDEPQYRNASDDDANPLWSTAMSWAKEAGRKLSVVEDEVWKKINGEK